MDGSCSMDTLDDTSTLPELSFDDLLDPSPIKKNGRSSVSQEDSDNPLEMDIEPRYSNKRDDSINTPVSKKSHQYNNNQSGRTTMAITNSSISSKPTPMRANPMKPTQPLRTTSTSKASGTNPPPVLLNSKNVLPKTATQITNNSAIKITPKVTGGTSGGGTSVSLGGKTAVRTSTGQLIYIQKTPSTTSSTSATTVSTSSAIKTTSTGSTAGISFKTEPAKVPASGTANKPMTIQVVRTADGNFVTVKSSNSTGGLNSNKNTTLALPPTTLAGKKLATSTGQQVVIKAAATTSAVSGAATNSLTTSTATAMTTATGTGTVSVKALNSSSENLPTKTKTILVQSSNGKQIMVSNPNLVKLSPKTQTTSSAGQTSTTSTLQLSGKTGGVQYVRVMPTTSTTKVIAKPPTVTSVTSTFPGTRTVTVVSSSASSSSSPSSAVTLSTSAGQNSVKILNNLPQKFTVLQKGTATKIVVSHKKDSSTGDFAAMASKVQKAIVTVPTIRSLNDDNKNKSQQQQSQQKQTLIKPLAGNQTIVRKHKISEINTEIKRITTTTSSEQQDDNGPPEIKKAVPNNRLVVISANNSNKLLNSSNNNTNNNQQTMGGRALTTVLTTSSGNAIQVVQGTNKLQTANSSGASATTTTSTTSAAKPLYTILKPSASGQQSQQNMNINPTKVFSVLKTNSSDQVTTKPVTVSSTTATTIVNASGGGQQKSLINRQSLVQQQQNILQLKQMQKTKLSQNNNSTTTTTSLSSSTTASASSSYLNIKIKEEPQEYLSESYKDNGSNIIIGGNYSVTSSKFTAPQPPPPQTAATETDEMVTGVVRRKHCNCSKSQCLKLYCDCFANGEFCQDCTCKDCFNNLENEDERQKAIKNCLERNPSAFKPKITSSSDLGDMRLHNKGCNCKRSGCLKNYCECYEAKIPCSSNCKCVGCRNIEDRADLDLDPIDPKIMATLANASNTAVAVGQKRAYGLGSGGNVTIKTEKYSKDIKTEPGTMASMTVPAPPLDKHQQCNFITQEVVDATIQCMITQADECEKSGLPTYQTEKMVMEELGRCLVEIIDFSIRNTDNSYSQD